MGDIIQELKAMWVALSGLMFVINYLQFISPLIANYVSTPENAIIFCLQIMAYLIGNAIISAIEGAILGLVTTPFIGIYKMLKA